MLSKVFSHVRRRLRRRRDDRPPTAPVRHEFYSLPPSCQIPKLGAVYERHFGRRTQGSFVEVGAYDGEKYSNTSCLADLGWSGHYLEPVPEHYEKCVERHKRNPRTTVSQVAVGPERGVASIHVAGPLSTMDPDTNEAFQRFEWSRNKVTGRLVEVPQIPLHDYLCEAGVPQGFDLLAVDVEGYEWEILEPFDIGRWQPKMVIVELHDHHPDYHHLHVKGREIVRYFEAADYRIIYKDFRNTIYVRRAWAEDMAISSTSELQ